MSDYDDYLAELEAQKQDRIKHDCGNGHHNWRHYYGGESACTLCGIDLQDARNNEHKFSRRVTSNALRKRLAEIDPDATLNRESRWDSSASQFGSMVPDWVVRIGKDEISLGETLEEADGNFDAAMSAYIDKSAIKKINNELGLPDDALTGSWVFYGEDPQGVPFTMQDGKVAARKIGARHNLTNYDDLLDSGMYSRDEAREEILGNDYSVPVH